MLPEVLKWWKGDDTGISSRAIVCFFEGIPTDRWGYGHPLDPSDFGRCVRLLEVAPHYRKRLPEMTVLSNEWEVLAAHWDELEALYREELPTGSAPKLYDRMQELLRWDKE